MKKQFSILGLSLVLALGSCSKESSGSTDVPISGQWKLVAVDGTFAGIHDNFAEGVITWDFNPATQKVTVVNNNTNPDLWDMLETGVYTYHFVNNPDVPCAESIDIGGTVYGCYSIANNNLVIDQSIADGYKISLKR